MASCKTRILELWLCTDVPLTVARGASYTSVALNTGGWLGGCPRGESSGIGANAMVLRIRYYFPQHAHSVFYWKIHLVLDCDTFRLELDYRSIMHILVKVLSNQDSGTRMVLIPVRVQIVSLGMVA